MEQARTIDEVLNQLTVIIDRSREAGAVDGYFAALYRGVTAEVRDRIQRGEYDDGVRMEQFDVVFANRYLAAVEADRQRGRVTDPWRLVFSARGRFWPVVVQHLLLGMNAHINYDLGLAAAEVAPGEAIHSLEGDFRRINDLLASLVDEMQDRLAMVWPPLRLLDRLAGGIDEAIVNFSMNRARDQAWLLALAVARAHDRERRGRVIAQASESALRIGQRVLRPGLKIGCFLKLVRVFERGTVSQKLAAMGD